MRFPYVLATSLVVAVLLSPPAGKAAQYKLKTLHSFCSIGGCSDGEHPFSGVLRGPGGAIYGTTIGAGKYDGGVVFKLDADNYNESVLHNFCKRMDCTDGAAPQADLIV